MIPPEEMVFLVVVCTVPYFINMGIFCHNFLLLNIKLYCELDITQQVPSLGVTNSAHCSPEVVLVLGGTGPFPALPLCSTVFSSGLYCVCLSVFVLSERSQDSVVVMLSDSNSTQDLFTDPTSSQDSSRKVHSGKGSASSSENTTPSKEGQSRAEEAGKRPGALILYTVSRCSTSHI